MYPLLALALVLLPQAPSPAIPAAPRAIDVPALLEPIRTANDVPGLVGAIVTRDGLQALGACGVRERGRDVALTAGDRMHLGSCTKSMTATLCALLVEDRKLSWTRTAAEAFPELAGSMHEAWKPATLEAFLTNRGGAPKDVPPLLWSALFVSKDPPRRQREVLVRATFEVAPASPPGSRYEYSNTGFSIAGHMAEVAAGRSWEDLMRERLFEPLGMTTAGFGPPGSIETLDEPRGHTEDGEPVTSARGRDNPPAISPAGRVHCSLADWAKYVQLHLRDGELPDGRRLLSADTVRKLHTEPPEGERYAFGWSVTDRAWGGRVLAHMGSNRMWYCAVWMAPEKGFAVLSATNQGGDAAAKACDEAAGALIRAWGERARADGSAK